MSYNLVNSTTGALTRVAGRGKAEYGASTIRSGTIDFGTVESKASKAVAITFDSPMPDSDYIVFIESPDWPEVVSCSKVNKTASGFQAIIYNNFGSALTAVANYTAFKLYSNVEINDLVNYGTRFPDYAHPITVGSTTWTATEDVYISFFNADNIELTIDGNSVTSATTISGGVARQFNGYVKKGSVLSSSRLTQAGNTQIWPLL